MNIKNDINEIIADLLTQKNNFKEYIEWLGDLSFENSLNDISNTIDSLNLLKFEIFGEPVIED